MYCHTLNPLAFARLLMYSYIASGILALLYVVCPWFGAWVSWVWVWICVAINSLGAPGVLKYSVISTYVWVHLPLHSGCGLDVNHVVVWYIIGRCLCLNLNVKIIIINKDTNRRWHFPSLNGHILTL